MAIDYKPHAYQDYATKQILENSSYGLFLDMGLRQNSLNVNRDTGVNV